MPTWVYKIPPMPTISFSPSNTPTHTPTYNTVSLSHMQTPLTMLSLLIMSLLCPCPTAKSVEAKALLFQALSIKLQCRLIKMNITVTPYSLASQIPIKEIPKVS